MLKVVITGTNGFVGQGALLECLKSPKVEKILSVTRRSLNRSHPKLSELVIPDFMALTENDERLQGYNTCIYCATRKPLSSGSSKAMEEEYRHFTYSLPLHFAKALGSNKQDLTFIYISGAGTSLESKALWAKVKAETERDLLAMKGEGLLKAVYNIRPALIKHSREQENVSGMQKLYSTFYWISKGFGMANLMEELGKSFIQLGLNGYEKETLDPKDITLCSNKYDELLKN